MKFVLPDSGNVYQEFTLREDDAGNVVVDIVPAEDVTDLIDANKRAQNEDKQVIGKGTQTSMFRLGELSALKAHQLMQDGTFWDDAALRKWFHDLDNYLWRVVHKKRRGNALRSSKND